VTPLSQARSLVGCGAGVAMARSCCSRNSANADEVSGQLK
jgi:hypothetical protein